MPYISAECTNCGESTESEMFFEIEALFLKCPECTNEVCPACAHPKNSQYHKDCLGEAGEGLPPATDE